MKRRLKMKITQVREQTSSEPTAVIQASCPVCVREVELLTIAQATAILKVEAHTLSRLIAEGRVHAIATVSGAFGVCKESLFIGRREK